MTTLEHLSQIMLADYDIVKNSAAVFFENRRFQFIHMYRRSGAVHLTIHLYTLAYEKLGKKIEIVEEIRFLSFCFHMVPLCDFFLHLMPLHG